MPKNSNPNLNQKRADKAIDQKRKKSIENAAYQRHKERIREKQAESRRAQKKANRKAKGGKVKRKPEENDAISRSKESEKNNPGESKANSDGQLEKLNKKTLKNRNNPIEKTPRIKEESKKRKLEQAKICPARKKRKLSQAPSLEEIKSEDSSLEEIKSQDPSLEKIKKLQETCNFVYLASDYDMPEYVNVKKVNLLDKGDEDKSYGVYAKKDIPEGIIIGEYTGEIFDLKNFNPNSGYSMSVKTAKGKKRFICDAEKKGNFTRFINYSEYQDNLEFIKRDGKIIIKTIKKIKKGQQLLVNYNVNPPKGYYFLNVDDSFKSSSEYLNGYKDDYDLYTLNNKYPSLYLDQGDQIHVTEIGRKILNGEEIRNQTIQDEKIHLRFIKTDSNQTPLEFNQFDTFNAIMLASYFGQEENLTFLIEKGADLNRQQNLSGQSALFFAIQGVKDNHCKSENCLNVIRMLIKNGANIFIQDKDSQNFLYYAIQHLSSDDVESILTMINKKDFSKIINYINFSDEDLIDFAIKHKKLDTLNVLLNKAETYFSGKNRNKCYYNTDNFKKQLENYSKEEIEELKNIMIFHNLPESFMSEIFNEICTPQEELVSEIPSTTNETSDELCDFSRDPEQAQPAIQQESSLPVEEHSVNQLQLTEADQKILAHGQQKLTQLLNYISFLTQQKQTLLQQIMATATNINNISPITQQLTTPPIHHQQAASSKTMQIPPSTTFTNNRNSNFNPAQQQSINQKIPPPPTKTITTTSIPISPSPTPQYPILSQQQLLYLAFQQQRLAYSQLLFQVPKSENKNNSQENITISNNNITEEIKKRKINTSNEPKVKSAKLAIEATPKMMTYNKPKLERDKLVIEEEGVWLKIGSDYYIKSGKGDKVTLDGKKLVTFRNYVHNRVFVDKHGSLVSLDEINEVKKDGIKRYYVERDDKKEEVAKYNTTFRGNANSHFQHNYKESPFTTFYNNYIEKINAKTEAQISNNEPQGSLVQDDMCNRLHR